MRRARRRLKALARFVFRRLPFLLQVRLARGNPEAAFYIRKTGGVVQIRNFLGKFRMEIDSSIDLQRRMLSGSYESDSMGTLPQLVGKDDVCLDIGANVGAISFALAKLSGEDGSVHAFEPGPAFASRFKRNLELNPGLEKQVHLHEVGLSDEAAELPWQASDVYTGTASMDPSLHQPHLPTEHLRVVRLDDFEPVQSLPKIDFIKIDVDGLELPIFRGALATLRKHKPKPYFETTLWNEEQKASTQEIERMLRELGYELYSCTGPDFRLEPARFPDLPANTVAIPSQDKPLIWPISH